MKMLKVLLVSILVIFIGGCEKKDEMPVYQSAPDTQPVLSSKTKEVSKELQKIVTDKDVFENLGKGEHRLEMSLAIDKKGNVKSLIFNKYYGPSSKKDFSFILDNRKFKTYMASLKFSPAKLKGKEVEAMYNFALFTTMGDGGAKILSLTFADLGNDETLEPLEEGVYTIADKMPQYKGGQDELVKFLIKNVTYPEIAKRAGIQGRVMVSMIIDENGQVTKPRVIKGIGGGCDEEALRVVNLMKGWTAGEKDGKPVKVRIVMPFMFKLQ